jgi:UDP-glucose 4-epimerase
MVEADGGAQSKAQLQTLLVTGGTGYIGSHTIVELLETDGCLGFDRIVIVDNLVNSSPISIDRVQQITGKADDMCVFEEVDLCDEDKLNAVFEKYGPVKSVIHFAGLKAVGESCAQPLKYYENNVGGSVSLVKCMLKNGCKNIVFSSSATLYGD